MHPERKLLNPEFDSTITEFSFLGVVGAYRARVAIALGDKYARWYSLLDEVISNAIGSLLGESQIRGRISGIVGVAADDEYCARRGSLDGRGGAIQVLGAVGGNLRAVGGKIDDVQVERGDEVFCAEAGAQRGESGRGLLSRQADLLVNIESGARRARTPDPVTDQKQSRQTKDEPQPGGKADPLDRTLGGVSGSAGAGGNGGSGTAGVGEDVARELGRNNATGSHTTNEIGDHESDGRSGGAVREAGPRGDLVDPVASDGGFECSAGNRIWLGGAKP